MNNRWGLSCTKGIVKYVYIHPTSQMEENRVHHQTLKIDVTIGALIFFFLVRITVQHPEIQADKRCRHYIVHATVSRCRSSLKRKHKTDPLFILV